MGYTDSEYLAGGDRLPVVLPCRGCGKQVQLSFNGGELDMKSCCGFVYELTYRGAPLWVRIVPPKGNP